MNVRRNRRLISALHHDQADDQRQQQPAATTASGHVGCVAVGLGQLALLQPVEAVSGGQERRGQQVVGLAEVGGADRIARRSLVRAVSIRPQ